MKKVLIFILLIFVFACKKDEPGIVTVSEQAETDSLKIGRIIPYTDLVDGQVIKFAVEIEYSLSSADTKKVMIGFNDNDHCNENYGADNPVWSKTFTITKGTKKLYYNMEACYIDWSRKGGGDFKIYTVFEDYPLKNIVSKVITKE